MPQHVAVVSQRACVGCYIDCKNIKAMSNIKNSALYLIIFYILNIFTFKCVIMRFIHNTVH